jgi:hypothetical protein
VSISDLFPRLLNADTSSNRFGKVRTSLVLPRKRNAALEALRPSRITVGGVLVNQIGGIGHFLNVQK